MSLPTFTDYIHEAPEHGESEHTALVSSKIQGFEDAPDHQTSGTERQSLTDHHKDAVSSHYNAAMRYTGRSQFINTALIHGKGTIAHPGHRAHHEELMSMHESAPALHHDVHVYSSLGKFNPTEHIQKSGGLFQTPAHVSASINPHIAAAHANFAKMADNVNHQHVLHMHLPKGSKCGTYIGSYSQHPNEQEFLVKPHTKFHITGSETHDLADGTKRTIWHATPHADHLHEATYHDTTVFRDVTHRVTPNPNRVKTHAGRVEQAKAKLQADNDAQSQSLWEKGPKDPNPRTYNYPDKELHEPVKLYTVGSHSVNKALIRQHSGAVSDEIDAKHHQSYLEQADRVSHALKHLANPLDSEIHVYSGISDDHMRSLHAANSNIVHTPAFTSTSLESSRAANHAHTIRHFVHDDSANGNRIRVKTESHILHFKLPKGYDKGAYIAGISHASREREFLLDKGQTWKVTKKDSVTKRFAYKPKATDRTGPEHPGHVTNHVTHIWTLEPHDSKLHEVASPIKSFTAHSRNINFGLHADTVPPSIAKRANTVEDHMKPHTGDHVVVYHGTKDRGFEHGGTYTPKGFISASHDLEVGRRFAKAHGFESTNRGNAAEGHLLHITVHPGVKTLNIGNDGSHYDEHEVVLNRNQPLHLEKMDSEETETGGKKITIHHWKATALPNMHEAVEHRDTYFNGVMKFDRVHGRNGLVSHIGHDGFKRIDHAPDHEEIQKQHASMRNSHKVMDADTQHIIKKYTGNSANINKHLIMPKPMSFLGADHGKHADMMSNAIKQHGKPLRHDVHVYSGLGDFDPTKHFDKTGTIHQPAFTSTSLNPTVALAFGPKRPDKQMNHIIHYHLPKGYKRSLYVAGHSAVKDEREMLLDRGQKWQLTGVKKSRVHIKFGKNVSGEKDHYRDVTVWSVRPHHSQLNEAYTHDPHPAAYTDGSAEAFDYDAPESNDHHHEEHLHLHALHGRDNDPEHVTHVNNYTHASYDINQHLITNGKHEVDAEVHQMHAHLQKAISEAKPLDKEHHVYSYCGPNPTSKKMTNSDGHMQTPAYTSTSINPEVAGWHANMGGMTRHIAHFHLPKGYTGGIYIGGHSTHHEQEMLLGPNQRFQKTHEHVITHEPTDEGLKYKTIIHTFKPLDHIQVHEALTHDSSLFDSSPSNGEKSLRDHAIATGSDHTNVTSQFSQKQKEDRHAFGTSHTDTEAAHLIKRSRDHYEKYLESGKHTHHTYSNVHDERTNKIKEQYIDHVMSSYSEDAGVNDHLIKKYTRGVGSPYHDKHEDRSTRLSESIKAHGAPLDQAHHVYSGLKGFNPREHFENNNGVIHTPAFTSTSINPHMAKDFAYTGKHEEQHILHFELPAGYAKGAYMEHHSMHPHEQEYLLDKGQSWKLKNHSEHHTHDLTWAEGHPTKLHVWTVVPHEDK